MGQDRRHALRRNLKEQSAAGNPVSLTALARYRPARDQLGQYLRPRRTPKVHPVVWLKTAGILTADAKSVTRSDFLAPSRVDERLPESLTASSVAFPRTPGRGTLYPWSPTSLSAPPPPPASPLPVTPGRGTVYSWYTPPPAKLSPLPSTPSSQLPTPTASKAPTAVKPAVRRKLPF